MSYDICKKLESINKEYPDDLTMEYIKHTNNTINEEKIKQGYVNYLIKCGFTSEEYMKEYYKNEKIIVDIMVK